MPASASNVPNHNGRKADSVSNWLRGIYNSAANFNMSNALRAANGRTMDRNAKQLHAVANESDKRGQSSKSSKSSEPCNGHSCPSHSARTCNCVGGECADDDGNDTINSSTINTSCNYKLGNQDGNKNRNENGNKVGIKNRNKGGCGISAEATRIVTDCYEHSAIRTEGQGASGRVRACNELRDIKCSNEVSRTTISNNNGLQSGDTRWN